MNDKNILNNPMENFDVHASTVGEFCCELLVNLIRQADEFSPKRPFGSSDWWWSLMSAIGVDDSTTESDCLKKEKELTLAIRQLFKDGHARDPEAG